MSRALLATVALGAAACASSRSDLSLRMERPGTHHPWVASDPAAWRVTGEGLELTDASDAYAPPHRSPRRFALLDGFVFGDVDLELEARYTGRVYGHQDLCVLFGFEDPANFYYVHLAPAPDPHACNVFRVDDAARVAVAPVPEDGVDWGDGDWRRIRVERRVESGTIRVWFDGALLFDVVDRTHGAGFVGVGSFDDAGVFRAVAVESPDATPARAPFQRVGRE